MTALSRLSAVALTAAVAFLSFTVAGSAGDPPLTHPIDVPSVEDRPLVDDTHPEDRGNDDSGGPSGGDGIGTGPLLPRPREPIIVVGGGDIPEMNPVDATCTVTDRMIWNGSQIIEIENTGDVVIPRGSKIVVTFSDGTTGTYLVSDDIKPGASVGFTGPFSDLKDPNASCSATVEIYVPEIAEDKIP